MPITLAQYEARERFLTEVQQLSTQASELMRSMGVGGGGFGFGRQEGPPDSPEARIRRVSRVLTGVYGSMNGRAVRPGTLYPPTHTQREAVAQAKRELAKLKGEVGG